MKILRHPIRSDLLYLKLTPKEAGDVIDILTLQLDFNRTNLGVLLQLDTDQEEQHAKA